MAGSALEAGGILKFYGKFWKGPIEDFDALMAGVKSVVG